MVDTGGLDPSAEGILGAMRAQTLRAVDEGEVLVFVVDVREGITAVDEEVARLLRRTGKPVFVAANKTDSDAREAAAAEVFRLGFEQVYPISATHGRGRRRAARRRDGGWGRRRRSRPSRRRRTVRVRGRRRAGTEAETGGG